MRQLIRGTTAYKIFGRDLACGRASHAYMLHFNDAACLRTALKYFALALFGAEEDTRTGSLIMSEGFSDVKVYPAEDKKASVADADEILADSALKPLEGDKKLFIFTNFESASAIVQNKLLKVLEEPPAGVYFLLGVTSLAPVLRTVLSRVRLLEIEPFSPAEILGALNRDGGDPGLNALAAQSCAGVYGQARAMVSGEWFGRIIEAANALSGVDNLDKAGGMAIKYGEIKEREELLKQLQRIYFEQLRSGLSQGDSKGATLTRAACIYAVEAINGALEDLKFNAPFSALLFTLLSGIVTENDKWKKLSE